MRGTTNFACLTYHLIGEGPSPYVVPEHQLVAQLAFLKAEGYRAEGFEELEARITSRQTAPSLYVILTVDDGHESSMRAADLFEANGLRATFFLTRDRCEKKLHFIRPREIRDLRKRGFSLGTHGTTHRKLTFMPEHACVEELKGSRDWLEDMIGEKVRYMAAPGGYINHRVLRLARENGYLLTGTCNEWMNSLAALDMPGTVNRVNIRRHYGLRQFGKIVGGNARFYAWRQIRAAALSLPKQLLR